MERPNVFQDALARLDRLGTEAGVGAELIDALRAPKATLTASLPVRMDDGSIKMFAGFRVQHNNARRPERAQQSGPTRGTGHCFALSGRADITSCTQGGAIARATRISSALG